MLLQPRQHAGVPVVGGVEQRQQRPAVGQHAADGKKPG
jgi:hypothetical protein